MAAFFVTFFTLLFEALDLSKVLSDWLNTLFGVV